MPTAGPDTAVILCGGRGTRLQEHAAALPKPLVEVGGRPIVWHVVSIYAARGVRRILLLTGFRSALVAEFAAAADWPAGVRVECVDTGLDTPTGGRIHAVLDRLGGAPFHATYGDGVADVDAFRVPGGEAMVAVWAWEGEGRVRARVFPNGIGIEEDEATGAFALQLGALTGRDIVIRQGGGSELHARPGGDGTVAVGGRVALVGEREYALPA